MGFTINSDMIVLARDACGLSQKQLAELVGVTQAKISKYENGLMPVAESDLDSICKATGFHRDFFRSTEPIYGLGSSVLFHRKRKAATVGLQRQFQAKVNIARIQVSRLLKAGEIEAFNKFESLDPHSVEGGAEEVARRVRAAWRIPMGPIRSVTHAIESAGGIVLLCDFDSRDIDAAHLWISAQPPMFFMNSSVSGDRHRFNLAHELGHAIMHQFPAGDVESEANIFAAEFLMPSQEIARELSDLTVAKLAALKQRWKVSMAALAYRAHQLEAISDARYTSLCVSLSRMGYRTAEPIEIIMEKPALITQLVELHRKAMGYTDSELLQLFMTDKPDFIDLGDDMNIRRPLRLDDSPLSFEAHLKRKQA